MKRISIFLTACSIALITACSTFGIATPKTFEEKALAAQLSVTTIRSTANSLLTMSLISVADAKNAQAAANVGNEGIDLAIGMYRQACPVLPDKPVAGAAPCTAPAATAKIDAIVGILTLAQTYLNTKGAKP